MAERLRIGVIVASTRLVRNADKVVAWFMSVASQRPRLELELLDLRDWKLPDYTEAKSPKMLPAGGYPTEQQNRWVETVARFDGFVIITPEFNHGYPGALKNALDHAYTGWNRKPVAFISYGGASGGTRAVQQLRLVSIELQMAPLRDEVNIPIPFKPLDTLATDSYFAMRSAALLDSLEWWAAALAAARGKA